MTEVYIGLGSNLSDPTAQLQLALNAIRLLPDSTVSAVSSLYGSRPMGPADQPDYINAVIKLDTLLTPLSLLDALQAIESQAGRVRKDNRWAARILDLDILLIEHQVIEHVRLTVPHYGLKVREFVLIPLQEIAPALMLPTGENIDNLCAAIDSNGLIKLGKLR